MNRNEHLAAKELDAFLAARMAGQEAPPPAGLPPAEAALAAEMVALAEATRPDPVFAAALETRLGHIGETDRRPVPLPLWRNLTGSLTSIETRRQRMLKRVTIAMAGAAALALLFLFGLPLLNSHQDLPPLPPLAALSAHAQGGDRTTGSGIFPGTEFVLSTTLPSAPDRVPVFQRPELRPPTIEDARRLAERFGLQGQVYVQQVTMPQINSAAPGGQPGSPVPTIYTVFDGPCKMSLSDTGAFYVDHSVLARSDTTATLPFEQAASVAEDFLRARGLLDFPYRVEPDEDAPESAVRFVRLADGHPVRNAEVRVTVAPDGRVATVSYPLLTLEPAGEYPIRSVQDAWEALRSGQPGGETQYTILRGAPGPAAGPFKFWRPQYRPGQRADLYGSPIGFLPAEGDGLPLVEMNGLRLYGDVQALSEQQGGNLHVWGQVRQEMPGVLALDVAGWEAISQPLSQPFQGTIEVKDRLVLLLCEDGETFVLPNPPDDLTDGLAVSVYGRETERTEGGYPVLDWQVLQTPPDTGPNGPHGTIITTDVTVVQIEGPPVIPTMPVPQTPLPPPPAPETHATATPVPVPTVAGQPAFPRPITHTIRAGETLQGIAWQHGVTVEAILRANGLTEPEEFRVGQVLVIPAPSETMDEVPSGNVVPVGPAPTPTAPPGGRTGISGGGYNPPPVLPTPPLEPGQRVEGLEGQLSATIYESADGESRTLRQGSGQALQVTLAERPLSPEPGWEVRLSGPGLAGIERYNRLRVRVWGRYVVEGDQPLIQVERYETAYPDQRVQAWLGTIEIATVERREVALFQTIEGERYVLAFSLRYPDGLDWYRQAIGSHQVLQEGVVRPETFGGYPVIEELSSRWGGDVDRMTGLESDRRATGAPVRVVRPEEPPLPGKAFVEQVELVYYAVPVADIAYAGGPSSDPSLRVVQPVWRFAGYTEDGAIFEVLIQAVRDEYLK